MAMRLRTDCEGFHRRNFLKVGTAGLLGLGLGDLLRLEARSNAAGKSRRKASGVIMVWLAGGPATIDMWDLKPEAPDIIRGEFKPVATRVPGVQVCEHLPRMAAVMDKCALVRSVHHSIPAHGPGTQYMTTGNRPSPALEYPSLGSVAAKVLPAEPGVPPYISFGNVVAGGAGYLGAAFNPFEVEGNPEQGGMRVRGVSLSAGFTAADLQTRRKLLQRFDAGLKALDHSGTGASLDRFQQQALDILRSDKTKKAFDVGQEPAALRDAYGRHTFGQSALVARRLVEAGARFVTIGTGGWDTHGNNFRSLRYSLLPQLDQTLSALVGDLDRRGLLESTVVYCAGEFGRTPRINGTAGRDHWARSMAVLLAGGGCRRGYAYGSTDRDGFAPASEPCSPDDVAATIFHCLGVGPHHELVTTSGRPVAIFREGQVLGKLLDYA